MYNLALIYIYEDKTDESIKESIKLLIKSSKLVDLFESTILLILILIRNYQANNKNFKNVLLNFTDKENEDEIFADTFIKSNYQIIENLCFLNTTLNGKYEEIYLNFKENDLLYQINLQPILAKDVNIGQERKTVYEKYNITKDFYLGFEY